MSRADGRNDSVGKTRNACAFRYLVTATLFALLVSIAQPTPAQIIFLRHAEKPATGSELNARGWERARALPKLFLQDRRVLEHGIPVAIYAGAPPKPGGSVRSIQTMEPTAKALGLKVNTSITRDEIGSLVEAIVATPAYEGKTVVVCWEHKKIPLMLSAFGWKTGPKRWKDSVFDRLWILDFGPAGPVRFRDLPERLLPGDSSDEPRSAALE
jgi:hypothetical protein